MSKKIRQSTAPPGGEPFHPREIMADNEATIMMHTGLFGVFFMMIVAIWNVLAFVLAFPFVLLGFAEIVAMTPNSWRIRWIRRD